MTVNVSFEGETIEQKIRRVVQNKEPIEDTAPIIWTDRKDGIQPQFNVRTDRFDIAIEAMDKVDKSYKAQREERHKAPETEGNGDVGKPESIQDAN